MALDRRVPLALATCALLAGCSVGGSDACDDPLRTLEEVLRATGTPQAERRSVDGAYCARVPTAAGEIETCKLPTPLYAERYAEDHDAAVEWLTITMSGPAEGRAEIVRLVDDARARCA